MPIVSIRRRPKAVVPIGISREASHLKRRSPAAVAPASPPIESDSGPSGATFSAFTRLAEKEWRKPMKVMNMWKSKFSILIATAILAGSIGAGVAHAQDMMGPPPNMIGGPPPVPPPLMMALRAAPD